MNREIKFRAWDVNECMTYFDLNPDVMIKGVPKPFKEILKQEEGFTLMQYTGLKDKNGKEIYEGDIIRYSYELDNSSDFEAEIVWYNGIIKTGWEHDETLFAGFVIKGDNGEQYKEDRYYYHEIPNFAKLEIIGNVYETVTPKQ